MTVSISAMVQAGQQFDTDQLQAFRAFIEVSKALKGAVQTVQQQADATFAAMQAAAESLKQPVAASGQVCITVLETDAGYMQALQSVRLLPADLNQPAVSLVYISDYLQQVDIGMQQRLAGAAADE